MVKYYFDKFTAVPSTIWTDSAPWNLIGTSEEVTFSSLTRGYVYNNTNNTYATSGGGYDGYTAVPTGSVGYKVVGGTVLQKYTSGAVVSGSETTYVRLDRKLATENTQQTTYTIGSLVQSNLVAEDGTYPTNGRHSDGFWYVRGSIANKNPVITPSTVPSGSIAVKPSFNYRVTDPDGDSMTVTESIDGIVFNTRTGVASGTQLTFTPTDLAWLRTRIKQAINVTITANDGNGGVTTANYPITRTTPAIDLVLKTPFETDVAARRLLLRLEGNIPTDAIVSIQVCNNAFDASPTWENATNLVLSGFPHPFTNKTKTATKWGVSFKVRVERGSSVLPIYIDGLGGAFD